MSRPTLSYIFLLVAALLAVGFVVVLRQRQQPQNEAFDNPVGGRELSSRYFTRFYIPVILSVLAVAFLIVLLTMSPGLPLNAMANV